MAPFSSRGPTVNLNIKPDVVAPGVNIRSSVAAYGGDYRDAYQAMNGTSMAAPNVTGLAVLLKQAHPRYSPFDVKAA
jgi:minor extracellular serine protease Vpr